MSEDKVNHPRHYTQHPSGVECITVTEHMNFNVGNAVKYLWRAGLKSDPDKEQIDKHIEDLEKAAWYVNREIQRVRRQRMEATFVEKMSAVIKEQGDLADKLFGALERTIEGAVVTTACAPGILGPDQCMHHAPVTQADAEAVKGLKDSVVVHGAAQDPFAKHGPPRATPAAKPRPRRAPAKKRAKPRR